MLDEDLEFVVGLGLITVQREFVTIANPVDREVIARALTSNRQVQSPAESAAHAFGC